MKMSMLTVALLLAAVLPRTGLADASRWTVELIPVSDPLLALNDH